MKIRESYKIFCTALFVVLGMASATAAQRADVPRQEKLLNGLRVHLWQDSSAPKLTVRLRVHSGSAFDQQGKEGTMRMLAESIFPNDIGREFFAEELEGSFKVEGNYDYTEFVISTRPDGLLTTLETLASSISTPTIDKETTDLTRSRVLAELKERLTDAAFIADATAAKRLLGTFPYGRPVIGTEETLAAIDFADLRFNYGRHYGADNATLAISGPFDREQVVRAVRRFFGAWLKSDSTIPSTFAQPEAPPTALMTVDSPKPGAGEMRYAVRGLARNDRDYAVAEIAVRIFEERLRAKTPAERRKLVSVKHHAHYLPGIVMFGLSDIVREIKTAEGSEQKVEANDIMNRALNDKITMAELAAARTAVLAARAQVPREVMWLDADTYKFASVRAEKAAFGSATLADVQRAADRIRSSPMVSVMVFSPEQEASQ